MCACVWYTRVNRRNYYNCYYNYNAAAAATGDGWRRTARSEATRLTGPKSRTIIIRPFTHGGDVSSEGLSWGGGEGEGKQLAKQDNYYNIIIVLTGTCYLLWILSIVTTVPFLDESAVAI